MKVHYFFRQFHAHQTSIEKLFRILIPAIRRSDIFTKEITNKYDFSLRGMIAALFFFRRNQGPINHITGDIHWAALVLNSKNTVLTIHDLVGLQATSAWRKKLYYFFWVYLPVKKLKYITVISEKTKAEILAVIPEAEEKITVIPNIVTSETVPLMLDKKNNVPHILIVGTRSNKNIELTIEGISGLDVFLTVIGPLSDDHVKLLEACKINYRNFKNISDEELNGFYDEADILCFPSLYEGFGLPILEAQARNCAVITSNISPMNDVAGDAALLIDPTSVKELRSAVKLLTGDNELKNKLVLAGRENIKRYSIETVTQQYIQLYEKIAANR